MIYDETLSAADSSDMTTSESIEDFEPVEEKPYTHVTGWFGHPVERVRGPSNTARLRRLDDEIVLLVRHIPMVLAEVAIRLGVSDQQIRDRIKASKGQRGHVGTGLFILYDGQVTIWQGGINRSEDPNWRWFLPLIGSRNS